MTLKLSDYARSVLENRNGLSITDVLSICLAELEDTPLTVKPLSKEQRSMYNVRISQEARDLLLEKCYDYNLMNAGRPSISQLVEQLALNGILQKVISVDPCTVRN